MNKLNKGKRLIVTLMSSGMATVMSFVVSFFLTPFITNMLGTEAYGFVTLSKNFVSYAVIISTALDSYATRYIAMEYHKRDFDKANSYVSSAFYGDTVIASIILAVGVIFVLFMERFLNVSPELLVSVKLLFLLVFVNFFFTTIKTVFNSTAYIKNRLDITGFVRVIGYVVEIILYLAIFKLFPDRPAQLRRRLCGHAADSGTGCYNAPVAEHVGVYGSDHNFADDTGTDCGQFGNFCRN